jgi:MFS family permease
MLAAWVLVPADGPTSRGKLDLFGASLFTTALVAVTVAFGRGADWGWTDRLTIGFLAIAPVAAAWFVYVERRATYPFIDLGLFRRGAYRALTGVASLQMVALFAITLAVPVYLVEGRDMGTGIAGLTTAALPASMLAGAPLAGLLADRVAARRILSAGALLVIAGALGLIAWPTTTVLLVLALVVVGLGISAIQSPAAAAATNVVSDAERGVALGLFNTCRFVLGGLGATAAALAFEAAATGERTAGSGLSGAEAGFRAAVAVAVLAGLAALAAARAVPEDLAAAADPTSVDDETAAHAPSR